MNTHGLVVDFGKYKGELYTRVPVSYLKWMVQSGHSKSDIAVSELDRRGTVTPEIEVSGHAIDRASLHCLDIWKKTRNKDEGLHAWLCRKAVESRLSDPDSSGRYYCNGMCFVFEEGKWPALKTVIRKGNKDD